MLCLAGLWHAGVYIFFRSAHFSPPILPNCWISSPFMHTYLIFTSWMADSFSLPKKARNLQEYIPLLWQKWTSLVNIYIWITFEYFGVQMKINMHSILVKFISVACPICQEGQSEKKPSWFFPLLFPIFSNFFTVRGGTLPPLHPQRLRHCQFVEQNAMQYELNHALMFGK